VLIFLNNIIPYGSDFDKKCLPWGWFIPALAQLSLFTPLVVCIYRCLHKQRKNRMCYVWSLFGGLYIACLGLCFILTYYVPKKVNGPLPFRIIKVPGVNRLIEIDYGFYSLIWMSCYFHAGSYLNGIVVAIVYVRAVSDDESSHSKRLIRYWVNNRLERYIGYLIGVTMIILAIGWAHPFIAYAENQSRIHQSLYAMFAHELFTIGYCLIAIPALFGKAGLFGAVHKCDFWRFIANLTTVISLMGPIVALWFFFNYSK